MRLTLYALEGCPYCEAAKAALADAGRDYDVVWVDERFSQRDAVESASGQRSVPVLVDDETGAVLTTPEAIDAYVGRTLA